jgi:dedicated sortase system histidine kinase
MNLRRQLLLVSLLLLSLPWAGCQFIREMEGALRHGQEQSLQATAQAVAAVLRDQEELIYPNEQRSSAAPDERLSLYAGPSKQPIIVDGYADGWEDIESVRLDSDSSETPLAVTIRAVTRKGNLYLLLQVEDPEVISHNPGLSPEPNGDRLVLRTWQDNRRQDYVIATVAPGSVRARPAGRIRGYWQDAVGGYTLELEIPLAYTGARLGFFLVDASSRAGGKTQTLGNIAPLETAAPPWLIYSPDTLRETLSPFSHQGRRIQVVDRLDWLIADITATETRRRDSPETFWLLRVIYRSILSQDRLDTPPAATARGKLPGEEVKAALAGNSANLRYRDPHYATRTNLAAAVPIIGDNRVIGAVVVRQSGEEYLSLTDRAFSHLLGYSMLALGVGAFGLLGFASLLSWRIGQLSRAASRVVSEDGVILDNFPRSRAADEIGELSRRYADLLDQLREYNDYLRTLSRKLSHELRTPITVIQTSLENLEQSTDTATASSVYLARAREGLARLNKILTAMSEASRLEESIRNNRARELDLAPLLQEIFAAYQSVYPHHQLTLAIGPQTAPIQGVDELIVQALDKLMDNAASFCPAEGRIELALQQSNGGWDIRVSNEGPSLPVELQERLFDPMVSLRERESGGVHLGLGLHIVRLISDFHRGRVQAGNLPDGTGVQVTLHLPGIGSTPYPL